MIGLPKTTEFNKRIPKQKFYKHLDISTTVRKAFAKQVKSVYWKNKIAVTTMNLAVGMDVAELEIFEICLNTPYISEELLCQIDRTIPYFILFLLEYDGKYQAWIGYKEAAATGKNVFKVSGYYHTEWLSERDLPLRVMGINLDEVYENFVRQIAGTSLKESVTRDERKRKLNKEIAALQGKIRKEKQLNKQMELKNYLRKLQKEREDL